MACHYEIFPDLDIARIVYSGDPSAGEIVRLLDRMDVDPAYHRTIDEIIFLDGLTIAVIDPALLDNICELVSGLFRMHNRSKRMALIAGRDPGRIMAARFQQVMARNPAVTVGLFDSTDEAMRFLGRTDSRLRAVGQECSGQ